MSKNRYYYCYDNYIHMSQLESQKNNSTIYYENKEPYIVYYPSNIKSGDCIVIRDEHHNYKFEPILC